MKKVLGITLVLVTCVLLGVSAQGAKEQVVKPLEFSVFYSDNATLPFKDTVAHGHRDSEADRSEGELGDHPDRGLQNESLPCVEHRNQRSGCDLVSVNEG